MPVYRVCLKDRQPEAGGELAKLGTLRRGVRGSGRGCLGWSGLAVRDISLEEIYALEAQLP